MPLHNPLHQGKPIRGCLEVKKAGRYRSAPHGVIRSRDCWTDVLAFCRQALGIG